MRRDPNNPHFDLLVEHGFIEPTDITPEGDALYQLNTLKGWNDDSMGLPPEQIRPFMQMYEKETLKGKIAPILLIQVAALFDANGKLQKTEQPALMKFFDQYLRPIVRVGSALAEGEGMDRSLAPCWHRIEGSRCDTDLCIVRRSDGPILSVCSRCGCVSMFECWSGTPWDVETDRSRG
jgi:hypothetical protein